MNQRNEEQEDQALDLPDIIRNESPVSLFGYKQDMDLNFVTKCDEVLEILEALENYCDASTANGTTTEQCNIEMSLGEAMQHPFNIVDRTSMEGINLRPLTLDNLKFMWCRLVTHYLEWIGGITEIRCMNEQDKLRLVKHQLRRVICLSVSWRTFQANLTDGICFGAGITFTSRDVTDPVIRIYGNELMNGIQRKVVPMMRELRLTNKEYLLVKLVLIFSQTDGIDLSPHGRCIVTSALTKYTAAIADFVAATNTDLSKDQVGIRAGKIRAIMPEIEKVREIDDRHLKEMTRNDVGNIKGQLTNEIY